jgi:hypothetical protein
MVLFVGLGGVQITSHHINSEVKVNVHISEYVI